MNIITASSSNLPTSHVPQHSHWEEVDGEGWEEGQYSPKSTTSCSVRKPRDVCDLIHLPTQTYLLKANHAWDEVPFKKKVPLAKKKPVFSDLGQGSIWLQRLKTIYLAATSQKLQRESECLESFSEKFLFNTSLSQKLKLSFFVWK